MLKLRLRRNWRVTACAFALVLCPYPCSAQSPGASPSQQVSAEDPSIPPAVAKELEALKRRIEQLEAELKARTTQGQPITKVEEVSAKAAPAANAAPAHAGAALPSPQQALVSEAKHDAVAPVQPQRETAVAPALAAKPEENKKAEPFAFADFSWLNGNSRTTESPLSTKAFTGEFRADTSYIYDFNHPQDHTLGGTTESGRTGEVQVQQLGIGGDFNYKNVRGRLMTQFGMYASMTPRNDASTARGQWDLDTAYRYLSEAYGGYHFDVLHGVNIDAGIFMSYIGLFSYYNFDNWAYQPSYVSSNTPWFFNGVRVQIFPTEHLKIEPWFINGWQSYGKFNSRPGLGVEILWRPKGYLSIVGNQYTLGTDTLGNLHRTRYHTDDSIEVKYFDNPAKFFDKSAFSLTVDAGCESGGGVSCTGDSSSGPKQSFLGAMAYNRFWFRRDLFALTLGGGKVNNPGRYLVLLPPINGATAASGTPYFTENPGDPFKAWDASATFDYMPQQFITFRFEFDHRAANVPYFSGPGGVTPPGGNTGQAGSVVSGWTPDLRKTENRLNFAVLVKL